MSDFTLWYTRCPVPTAFGLAVRLGWVQESLRAVGVELRSLATNTDPRSRQSHFDHGHANFFRHGGNIPPLIAFSRGADLKLIGLSRTRSAQRLIVHRDSSLDDVSGLAGKRVSVPRRLNDPVDFWRATVLRGFEQALATSGLTLADVQQVEVPIGRSFVADSTSRTGQADSLWDARFMLGHQREEILALERGEVDALFTEGAIAELAQGFSGARTLFDFDERGDPDAPANSTRRINNCEPLAFTVSGRLARDRPVLVERVVAEAHRAALWARDNEKEAKRHIAAETGLPEELVDRAFTPKVHLQLGFDLKPDNLQRLQSQQQHLARHGFIDEPQELERFLLRDTAARAIGLAQV